MGIKSKKRAILDNPDRNVLQAFQLPFRPRNHGRTSTETVGDPPNALDRKYRGGNSTPSSLMTKPHKYARGRHFKPVFWTTALRATNL